MAPRPRVVRLAVVAAAALVLTGASAWAYLAWWTTPELAPGFELESTGFENGTPGEPVRFSLEDYRGKTVVLDFMAVSCLPCRIVVEEDLRPLYEANRDAPDFALVSINVWAGFAGEGRNETVRLQEREGLPWRHALGNASLMQDYGAIGIPFVAVVDPEGRLVYADGGLGHDGLSAVVEAARQGAGKPQSIPQVGIVTLSFIAGAATVFTPCSVGLLPGYVGRLVGAARGPSALAALRLGLVAGLGVASLYLVLGLGLLAIGPRLTALVEEALPFLAAAFVLVGFAMALGATWPRWLPAMHSPDGGMYSFGLAYGLASFGCVGPVFLPILAAAFLRGPWTGILAMVAYVGALAALLVVVALAVSRGAALAWLRRWMARARAIQAFSGALMVAAGAYMLWLYGRAQA